MAIDFAYAVYLLLQESKEIPVDEIKSLEAWINEFETEVDSAIQVSNATHTITIDI